MPQSGLLYTDDVKKAYSFAASNQIMTFAFSKQTSNWEKKLVGCFISIYQQNNFRGLRPLLSLMSSYMLAFPITAADDSMRMVHISKYSQRASSPVIVYTIIKF